MISILSTTVLALSVSPCMLAQQAAPSDSAQATSEQAKPQYHVVTKGTNINVRTAASVEGGYPFFQVNGGDLIEVLYEKYGWSRVQTSTPIFKKSFGYVSADAISVDGNVGTVIKRTTLRAPNLNKSGRVDMSWEGLDPALASGTTLELIDLVPGENGTQDGIWKVRLPRTHKAWINSVWLRPATADEIAAANPQPITVVTEEETVDTTESTGDAAGTTESGTGETEVASAEETEASDADEERELTPEEQRAAKLAALDEAFRAMLKEDLESAELELLQQQFIQFAADEEATETQRATAEGRASVLTLKIDVQDRLSRLKSMRDQTRIDGENISATRVAMDFRAPFDIVGRLNASIVFNGKGSMPQLYRLQDPTGRHTIAYLVPDDRYDLAAMTGLLVGIVGTTRYDEALELNVITPRRIDLVADPNRIVPAPGENTSQVTAPTVVEAETASDAGDAE